MRYTYTESVIPGKEDQHYRKRLLMFLILTVASSIMAAVVSSVFWMCAILAGVACYRTWQSTDVEYEYVHTNDIFDIDKVIRNASRKQILSINLN